MTYAVTPFILAPNLTFPLRFVNGNVVFGHVGKGFTLRPLLEG